MTERMAADRSSLGFAALGAKSQRGSDAFVFFDRVEKVTGLRYVNEAQDQVGFAVAVSIEGVVK